MASQPSRSSETTKLPAPFPPMVCNGTIYFGNGETVVQTTICDAITIRDGFVHYIPTEDPLTWWSVPASEVQAIRWPEGAGSR